MPSSLTNILIGDAARCTHDEPSMHAADARDHPHPHLSEDL